MSCLPLVPRIARYCPFLLIVWPPLISTLFPYTTLFRSHPACFLLHSLRCWPRWSLQPPSRQDRKSTRLNSSHTVISYAVFCLKKKNNTARVTRPRADPTLIGSCMKDSRRAAAILAADHC